MTRVGILSIAHPHAEDYLPTLQEMPDVEVVGFSDEDPARAEPLAARTGSHYYRSHEELLAEGLDAVVVCSENSRHRPLVEMAAGAGAHVLCEKQIATTLEDAEEMRDACEKAGVRFMTAFPMRFTPSVIAAREMVRRGDLGAIRAVNGINHSVMPTAHRPWFADSELAGGGAVMDHTPHLVDLLRWTLDAEVTSVYAEVGNPVYPGQVEVDTAGLVTVTFSNGAVAAIDSSWSRPNSYPTWGHLKYELVGERGLLQVDAFAEHLNSYSPTTPSTARWIGYGSDANAGMLREFLSSAREDREPLVGWKDGYEALRVALACYELASTHRPT
jgi:UDP-N-acetylglucosamine 3-dehydrogenase